MIDLLVGFLAIVLIFFLPGFFLVLIIFPKKGALDPDYDVLYKFVLGIVLSALISILTGMVIYGIEQLKAAPEVQSERLWLILGSLSIVFGAVAWYRGGLRIPFLRRSPAEKTGEDKDQELERLTTEKKALQQTIGRLEGEEYQKNEALKQEASMRIAVLKEDIEKINARIEQLLGEEEKRLEDERTA